MARPRALAAGQAVGVNKTQSRGGNAGTEGMQTWGVRHIRIAKAETCEIVEGLAHISPYQG